MDWVSLLLSLGIFGVLLAFVIERIWKACEESRDKRKFLQSIKKELEECDSLLKGEGNLLPIDMWKSGIFTGSLKLIPYEIGISLARVYFEIECHNYEAEKVRDVGVLAYTTAYRPKVPITQIKKELTHAQLLHSVLSERLVKKEKDLRADIERLLKQNIWDC